MKDFIPTGSRNITTQKVVKILYEHGVEVSPERAKLILDFLYEFAKLSVKQVTDRDSDEVPPEIRTPRKMFR